MFDEFDELENALRANGWASAVAKTLLSRDDEAVAAKLLGKTNARRMVSTPIGRRTRLVKTKEVYAVPNSLGWMIGAQEGNKERVLNVGLSRQERDRVLAFARERGFDTAIYDNPAVRPFTEPKRPSNDNWDIKHLEPSRPATPSGHMRPSRRLAILNQLKGFKAG